MAPTTTVTRNMELLTKETGNIYETVIIVSRRANQISVEMKQELNKKLEEFASFTDNLEEGKIFYRNPDTAAGKSKI
jgi:DNA-directed RNA polymerase subunit K/omega